MLKRFVIKSNTIKILGACLTILILAILLWSQLTTTLSHSKSFEQTAGPGNASEDTLAVGMIPTDEQASNGETLEQDVNREAAAGPQMEDSGPQSETQAPALVTEDSPPLRRVGIQAGHWKTAELPDELARLRTSTGTTGGGVAEWELNLDIAKRVAPLLEAKGLTVDVLPSTIPPGYKADAFVALHADGDSSGQMSGFKLARARVSSIPDTDDALLNDIQEEYQAVTKLRIDPTVSRNMTGYYVFPYRRFKHSIAPSTPGVILEMGFLTNASDRVVLLNHRDTVANGIAQGILRFLTPILNK